MESGDTIWIDA